MNTILQLRLHPAIIELKRRTMRANRRFEASRSTSATSRREASGISIHGRAAKEGWWDRPNITSISSFMPISYLASCRKAAFISMSRRAALPEYERARVRWFLSIGAEDLPEAQRAEDTAPSVRSPWMVKRCEFSAVLRTFTREATS